MSSISFTLKQIQNLKCQNLIPDSMPTMTQKEQQSQTQSLAFDPKILEKLFPLCAHFLDKQSIGTLLASTRIVGMQTPGLHSIYSSLSLTQNPTAVDSQNLHYTHKTHPLLNITTLHFTSPMQGVVKAFIRPQKIPNQNLKSLLNAHTNTLSSKPFATQRALVIGAGKGLGNTCAKLLALGGARVLATTQNFDESHEHISTLSLDILKLNAQILKALCDFQPTHLYYFATPDIRALTPNNILDKKQLLTYLDYYVLAPSHLLNALKSLQAFFQPSSIFVEELPLEFCEYTLAKTTLESFALFLEKQGLHTATPRLPKVATNQTLSLIPQKLKSPSDALINELLNFAKTQKGSQ